MIKYGPVVYGANTYNYQLTGAPLVWNALGIARQLKVYIRKNNIESFNIAHLEILFACLNKNQNIAKHTGEWLSLYEELKSMIFETLMNE